MPNTTFICQEDFVKATHPEILSEGDIENALGYEQVCIKFSPFTNGTAFSLIKLLRLRGFVGNIIVEGEYALDQLPYLQQIGADQFVIRRNELATAEDILSRGFDSYGTLQGVIR
jgi:uncharacterized protein (DUF934 family)